MKERLLDVIKWGLILIIAGTVFYVVYPKYELHDGTRFNKMNGQVSFFYEGVWERTLRTD